MSPTSYTSVSWKGPWPIKLDIVWVDSLWLLTTHWRLIEKLLTVSGEPSAAAAQAARMAAILQAAYPSYCPKTIRALLVQDAPQPHDHTRNSAHTTRYTMPDMHRHEIPWPAEGPVGLAANCAALTGGTRGGHE